MNPIARLLSLLPKLREQLQAAFGRFPWVLMCGTAGFIVASTSIHLGNRAEGFCGRLLICLLLGMPLFFSLRMIREGLNCLRLPLELAGAALLAGFFFYLPENPNKAPLIIWIRWWLLLACLHFAASFSPYIKGSERPGFWQFNRHLFLRFALATLYSAVLCAGLELALLSAEKLFSLSMPKAYGDLFFFMAGCFHPAFFLAGIPRDLEALDIAPENSQGLKLFTQFALAPLAAVYTLLLYIYAGKILLIRQWPHGWVALPVLILAGVGILAVLLLHPLRNRLEEKWAGWFSRWFPRAMAPLSLLLLLAIRERVAAYGVTEERYLGLVAGFWILAWSLASIFKPKSGLRWIPASLALICLGAAFGPASAGSISKQSQTGRLNYLLTKHGILEGAKFNLPAKAKELPAQDFDTLHSIIQYLFANHGGPAARQILGAIPNVDWDKLNYQAAANDLLYKLNLKAGPGAKTEASRFHHMALQAKTPIPVEGFRRSWILNLNGYAGNWKYRSQWIEQGLAIGIENGLLHYSEKEGQAPSPIELSGTLFAGEDRSSMPLEKMSADWALQSRKFRIVFTSVDCQVETDGKARLQNCQIVLLEK